MRVQSIIRELRGEKIDIIEFSEEITTFAEKALQPAKVARVSIADLGEKQLEVIVDDTQLSLAIGKKGQNVRLAAKLLGWKIDIKSEEEKRQEVEQQMTGMSGAQATPIEQLAELGEAITEKLVAAGITTVESLADMTPEQLEEIPGIGERTLEKITAAVRNYFVQMDAQAASGAEQPQTEAEGVEVAEMENHQEVDLSESSVYGKDETMPAKGQEDVANEADIVRLETITGGADEPADGEDVDSAARDRSDAETAEEIDALEIDLHQPGDLPDSHDGSGRVVDDLAEERLAEVTETGRMLDGDGAEALTPGRDDTSAVLREHHPNTEIARSEAIVEGNLDEARDERKEDAKVDEGGN
jgi:N utilization substance protein A